MNKKTQSRKSALMGAGVAAILALALGGCESTYSVDANRINLATYAPVIDVQGQGYDVGTYYTDLEQCRTLGLRVQATYEERRKAEQARALKSAAIGAAVGAALGSAVSDANNSDRSDGLVAGALYGAAIGGASGEDQIDTTRQIARFGPTIIVDKCMTDRGYKILSVEGTGGG